MWFQYGKKSWSVYRGFSVYAHLRPYTGKIRWFTSVYRKNAIAYCFRISSYTVTDIYDRNKITCFMAKYGRTQSVYGIYTLVYDCVYDRLRPYNESVTVNLGRSIWNFIIENYSRTNFLFKWWENNKILHFYTVILFPLNWSITKQW